MLGDLVYIFFASFFSAGIAEFLNWLLIYRTDEYQRLKNETEKLQKKLDKKKESVGANTKDKKVNRFEERHKAINQSLSMVKMKSMFAVAVVMISLFGFLSSTFDGQVVCKLPFTPFGMLQGISHRNLPGQDYTDCSFVFFYIICSMAIRNNLQKVLGFAPPKQANNQLQTPFS